MSNSFTCMSKHTTRLPLEVPHADPHNQRGKFLYLILLEMPILIAFMYFYPAITNNVPLQYGLCISQQRIIEGHIFMSYYPRLNISIVH